MGIFINKSFEYFTKAEQILIEHDDMIFINDVQKIMKEIKKNYKSFVIYSIFWQTPYNNLIYPSSHSVHLYKSSKSSYYKQIS